MRSNDLPLVLMASAILLVASVANHAQDRPASDIDQNGHVDVGGGVISDIVHVRSFGAVGDGVTDDYAAFRRALDRVPLQGGTLYIASGDYLLSESLRMPRGNIDVVCGNNARLIVGGPGVKLLKFGGEYESGGRVANVRVTGCKFWDPAPLDHVAIEESHGIVLVAVDHAILERLEFVSMGDESVDIIRSSDVRVLNSRVVNGCAAVNAANAGSFSINSSSRVQLRGNVFENQLNGSAVRVEVHAQGTQSDHLIIADNQIFGTADTGGFGFTSGSAITVIPAANQSTTISITGNQIVNPYRYGIFVKPLLGSVISAVVIQGNTVSGGGAGIATTNNPNYGAIAVVGNTSLGTVVGNVVQNWGTSEVSHSGIRIIGNQLAVVGNVVSGVDDVSIRETNELGPANVIMGNVIEIVAPEVRPTGADGCRMAATTNDGEIVCRP